MSPTLGENCIASFIRAVIRASRVLVNVRIQGCYFSQKSHQGTGQFHAHLIAEKLLARLNTQVEMETLFHKRLPHKVKALSKWKSIDIQRISQQDDDYKRISIYLGKQTSLELIALDPFNSDLSARKK